MIYKNLSINDAGHLVFAGHDTTAMAAQFGTPLLVMDEALVRSRCRAYITAMKQHLPAGSHPQISQESAARQKQQ